MYKTSLRGTSDSVADFSVYLNPADAHNVSCLGHWDICPKTNLDMGWLLSTVSCQYLYIR